MGAVAGLLAFGPLGRTEAAVGPGRIEVVAAPTRSGSTVVELPPLGRVQASTHAAPLELTARVLEVDIDAAQRATSGADPVAALRAQVDEALPGVLRTFLVRSLLAALVAGALLAAILPGRRWWYPLVGASGGLLAVGGLLVATWGPYDIEAFEEPQLTGELERVPGLLVAAERNLAGIDQVRDRVDVLSSRLAELYASSVGELPGGAPGETAILHVSDLHLNPLAAELVVGLAGDLQVDAVLDTGDITTFGLALEARFGALLEAAPVPYYLVPGNHDSLENRVELGRLAGITLLDGEVVTVGGVRILGIADPTFTASNEVSTSEANERKASLADDVREQVAAARPDVLAVHDRAQAAAIDGEVPLVVAGHLHKRTDKLLGATRVLTVGSTGAAGLESFAVETAAPYEAQVLRFRRGRLVAIDYLKVSGIDGAFTLERTLVEPPERAASGRAGATTSSTTTTSTSAPSTTSGAP